MRKRRNRTRFTHKTKLTLRSKDRPVGSRFDIELRLLPVRDVPFAHMHGYRQLSTQEVEQHAEMVSAIQTIRENIRSRFKIVQNRRRGMIQTKVLLEREADLFFLAMAHSSMIFRAYRYRDTTAPSH